MQYGTYCIDKRGHRQTVARVGRLAWIQESNIVIIGLSIN